MRILFISAFYPPFEIGGWEQLAQEVNSGLSARGHACRVLCSSYDNGRIEVPADGVDRVLSLESDQNYYDPMEWLLRRKARRDANLSHTREVIERFRPDVVFVQVMWNLSRAVPWMAERLLPGRVVYYVADDWPYSPDVHTRFWLQPAQSQLRRLPKRLLGSAASRIVRRELALFPLEFQHVLCVSNTVRENLARFAGIDPERMRVVYNGIDVRRFAAQGCWRHNAQQRDQLAMLYAGNLVTHKGVRTAIEAMVLLAGRPGSTWVTLDIVGSGHPDYEADLRKLVIDEQIQDRVRFRGRVARDRMPELMAGFDVLVFPSTGPEALPRIVQEAMASGLIVVGTTIGGTAEILANGETGLTFEPGDAAGLARQIGLLIDNPTLRSTLRTTAQARVAREFDIRRMIDEVEQYLATVAATTPPMEGLSRNTAILGDSTSFVVGGSSK